ncbi:1-phosphofructokinase family hexose kinase [Corynebacterium sp. A21]|uniref:1-phosphofructokinase family hexose kinase n=1 Tax=Corynebacterium sp. A21 TaxID=3457318 RepID=UPI003FD45177
MILTFTPNPSIDRSLELSAPLQRGAVQRLRDSQRAAGGKGINVAHTLHLAGYPTLAVLPAREDDPMLRLIDLTGLPYSRVDIPDLARINTTVTEPDGTTTKLNGPGARLDASAQDELFEQLLRHAPLAQWLVMAGSLPPGVPLDWYSQLIRRVHSILPEIKIAVDTSDRPLLELARSFSVATPDLIKPNVMELGQLCGIDSQYLESQAAAGDLSQVLAATQRLMAQGLREVLVTLGPAGALLVNGSAAWYATVDAVRPVSTVGAGDALLAGYLLGRVQDQSPADALAQAVAYGRAAVELPGTTMPSPEHLSFSAVRVTQVV